MSNPSEAMEYVLDEQLLANIKSSDHEGDGDTVDDIQLEDHYTSPALNAEVKDCDSDADPLLDTETALPSNFPWLFKDEDILLNDLESKLPKPEAGAGRGKARKRGRPSSGGLSSRSGCTWSRERANVEDLPLPSHEACGKGPARTVSNAVEAWLLLFDDAMLRQLMRYINEQIRLQRNRATDLIELRAWLGLNYLCGVFRNAEHNGPLEELWTLELGNAIFRATMTLSRFEFINTCLSRAQSWDSALRLWQKLLINCRSYYGASSWLCVEPQPSTVSGIAAQFLLCCDAKTNYMTNAKLLQAKSAAAADLDELICDFKTTGRNLTLSSPLSRLSHCQRLLQLSQLSTLSSLTSSCDDWPNGWSSDDILYSGGAKLNSDSSLSCGLSSQVNALRAHEATAKSCCQFQQLAGRYSTSLASSSSSSHTFLQLLQHMLNVAAFNAWVLLRLSPKGDFAIAQRDFQRQLGLFLTQQRLQRRLLRRSTTSLVTKLQICEILGQPTQRLLNDAVSESRQSVGAGVLSLEKAALPEGVILSSRYGEKHRRCKPCSRLKRESKSRSRCQQCLAHRCGNHLISRCYECSGVEEPKLEGVASSH